MLVTLAWLRQHPQPVIPIIGARMLDQVKDNLACTDVRLTPAQIDRPSLHELLARLSRPRPQLPLARMSIRRACRVQRRKRVAFAINISFPHAPSKSVDEAGDEYRRKSLLQG